MFRLLKSNWGLVCANFVAAAFLAEWALRLLAPQPLIHTLVRHDPLLGARGVPFGQVSIVRPDGGRHTVRLNAMGFRMREELSRSNDRHRILVYGGGAIFSAHLPIQQTVFGLLKNAIEAKTPRFQLVNAAISGHSIQSTRLLMMEQIPVLQPRALVYVFDAGTLPGRSYQATDPLSANYGSTRTAIQSSSIRHGPRSLNILNGLRRAWIGCIAIPS